MFPVAFFFFNYRMTSFSNRCYADPTLIFQIITKSVDKKNQTYIMIIFQFKSVDKPTFFRPETKMSRLAQKKMQLDSADFRLKVDCVFPDSQGMCKLLAGFLILWHLCPSAVCFSLSY